MPSSGAPHPQRPLRIVLSAEDFYTLISGRVVQTDQAQVLLSDIGWDKMAELLEDAEIAAIARRGSSDSAAERYTPITSSVDVEEMHQGAMQRLRGRLDEDRKPKMMDASSLASTVPAPLRAQVERAMADPMRMLPSERAMLEQFGFKAAETAPNQRRD